MIFYLEHYPGQHQAALAINPMGKMPALETEHGFHRDRRHTAALAQVLLGFRWQNSFSRDWPVGAAVRRR